MFLLAGLYAMQQRSHIRIYIIYDMMPRWAQKLSDTVSVFLIFSFTFALVWGGYNDAETRLLRMETFGTAWDPPIPGIVKPALSDLIVLVASRRVSNLIADWNKETPEHIRRWTISTRPRSKTSAAPWRRSDHGRYRDASA